MGEETKSIDKYSNFSTVPPIAAPAAPAALLISILYHDMILEGMAHEVALVASVGSGIGAEMSGMIAAYVGVQAFQRRKYGLMVVAAVAFIAYAVFMAVGISVTDNPVTMISTILISIIAYFAVGLLKSLQEAQAEEHTAKQEEIKRLDAERKLANSRARLAKAGGVLGVRGVREQDEQQPEQDNRRLDAVLLAKGIEYLRANPTASVRGFGEALGIPSSSTASKYRALAAQRLNDGK